jgi:hypothetical protein
MALSEPGPGLTRTENDGGKHEQNKLRFRHKMALSAFAGVAVFCEGQTIQSNRPILQVFDHLRIKPET